MNAPRETLYDVIGVRRDAQRSEIVRACGRLSAEFRQDATPPDRRREALLREALEVLTDDDRRAEYDASLVAAPAAVARRRVGVIAGVAVALMAAGAYLFMGKGAPAAKAGRTVQEIQAEVVSSIGRVQSIGMSGPAVSTGLAFAVARGVMVTTCEGLAPGAQIQVTMGARAVAARIAMADEALGLCKLAVDGAGSWPVPLSGVEAKAGDKVYAAGLNAAGDVVLAEGAVKSVAAEAQARVVVASVPVAPGIGGRPLLDIYGRLVGVAMAAQPGGAARHVIMPTAWVDEPAAAPSAPPAAPVAAEPPRSAPGEAIPGAVPGSAIQGRAEGIARKIRPPPTVPDNL